MLRLATAVYLSPSHNNIVQDDSPSMVNPFLFFFFNYAIIRNLMVDILGKYLPKKTIFLNFFTTARFSNKNLLSYFKLFSDVYNFSECIFTYQNKNLNNWVVFGLGNFISTS